MTDAMIATKASPCKIVLQDKDIYVGGIVLGGKNIYTDIILYQVKPMNVIRASFDFGLDLGASATVLTKHYITSSMIFGTDMVAAAKIGHKVETDISFGVEFNPAATIIGKRFTLLSDINDLNLSDINDTNLQTLYWTVETSDQDGVVQAYDTLIVMNGGNVAQNGDTLSIS